MGLKNTTLCVRLTWNGELCILFTACTYKLEAWDNTGYNVYSEYVFNCNQWPDNKSSDGDENDKILNIHLIIADCAILAPVA
jgi:hypothetical protein